MQAGLDKFIFINGAEHHYLDWGGEGKTILFLAGLADTAYSFQRFAPRFTGKFRAIGLTRRGFGKSAVSIKPAGLDTSVKDIADFLDALEISQVSLIAHSYAGYEMTYFTLLYPERVEKLIYLDAVWIITKEELEARVNDPVYKCWPQKPPVESLKSISTYFRYIRDFRTDFDKLWSALIENMILQGVRIHSNGTIEELDRGMLIEALVNSALEYKVDYSGVKAPVLCLYSKPEQHPHEPVNSNRVFRERAWQYYMKNIYPFKRRSVEQLMLEKQDAIIFELTGADHYCHISNEDQVYRYVSIFMSN